MQKNSQDFSMEEAARLAQTPAGQRLLTILRSADPDQLQQITDQASSGNYEQANRILREMLSSSEARKILNTLEEVNHGRSGK
jgi:hypothetical protein